MADNGKAPLVKVEGLRKLFPVGGGLLRAPDSFIHAVDDINFEIPAGKSLGLVGESGCGKTTTGKLLVRLYEPTSGRILIQNSQGELEDVAFRKGRGMKTFRKRV
jgi:ABC-type oligopeptide transport system ATPase subunit